MVGKLFCCVDGGGTKTKVALYNEEDHLLGITKTGPTNLTLYADDAWNIITKALYGLISNASMEASVISNVHFGIGIAGANNLDQRKNLIEKCLLDFKEVRVATDSYIAALGAHGGHPGGIVIVGTGSVGYRINNDSESKLVGGLGFQAGDHGFLADSSNPREVRERDFHLDCGDRGACPGSWILGLGSWTL